MTQDDLAEALGTATRNVQRLEAGENLTLHRLARIASALGVVPDDLLRRAVPRAPPRPYATGPHGQTLAVAEAARKPAKKRPR